MPPKSTAYRPPPTSPTSRSHLHRKSLPSLGLYERSAATAIGVPRSLQGHERAMAVWQQILSEPEPLDLAFFQSDEYADRLRFTASGIYSR